MARNFIKTLVISTVLVSGVSVSSARADAELGEFLAATIFMFALANAIGGDVTVEEPKAPVRPTPRPVHGVKRNLPKSCEESHITQQGQVKTLGARCLERKYRYFHQLPDSCEQTLWTTHGIREGYSPSCLRRSGYRVR